MIELNDCFKVYTIADLQALPKPDIAFVIYPLVPIPGITILHGRWGTGKTAVLMTEAVSVASGKPFLGLPVSQGNVLVVEADMPDRAFRYRFHDFIGTLDPALPIKCLVTRGFNALAPTFKNEPLGLELDKVNREFHPKLVIVDTLRKTHTRDEREGSTPVEVYDYWMSTFPDSAIQIMAHDRKLALVGKGQASAPAEESFSGHQGWLNDAQSAMHISPTGKGFMKIEHTKSQVGEADMRIDIKMRADGTGVDATSDLADKTVDDVMKIMPNAAQADIDKEISVRLGVSDRTAREYKRAWRQKRDLADI